MMQDISKRVFVASIIFFVTCIILFYGIAIGKYHIWPYTIIEQIYRASKSLVKYGDIIPENRIMKAPSGASRKRYTIHNPAKMNNGYYVFLGWDDKLGGYAAWLLDSQGAQLHTWVLDYYAMDPDGPLNNSDSPHAFKVLADGSILVSFDKGDVMSRLDSCSKPKWSKQGVYHHSLEKAENGTYWTWRSDGTAYGHYHYLENFNPETGKTVNSIGLIEDIIANMGDNSIIFGIRPDYNFIKLNETSPNIEVMDLFHPNDIDILYSDIAHKFPNFKKGDLLLSFRNLHLVAVLDTDNNKIKWWSHGPWRAQHDPDFTNDGMISVFSNNTGTKRSETIKIDPTTRIFSNELYNAKLSFYTASMGKHQYLPNGNILIVVSGEGRILEVTKHGEKVMEFNNLSKFSNEHNVHVSNGVWLQTDFFDNFPKCTN